MYVCMHRHTFAYTRLLSNSHVHFYCQHTFDWKLSACFSSSFAAACLPRHRLRLRLTAVIKFFRPPRGCGSLLPEYLIVWHRFRQKQTRGTQPNDQQKQTSKLTKGNDGSKATDEKRLHKINSITSHRIKRICIAAYKCSNLFHTEPPPTHSISSSSFHPFCILNRSVIEC